MPLFRSKKKLDYRNLILSLNPLGYWNCSDTGSTLTDSSKNALNGTIGASVTKGAAGVSGGTCLSTDGTNTSDYYTSVPNTGSVLSTLAPPMSIII